MNERGGLISPPRSYIPRPRAVHALALLLPTVVRLFGFV